MQSYSLTYAGAIAMFLASISFLSEAEALTLVNAVVIIIGFLATAYGRYRKGGVSALGVKK